MITINAVQRNTFHWHHRFSYYRIVLCRVSTLLPRIEPARFQLLDTASQKDLFIWIWWEQEQGYITLTLTSVWIFMATFTEPSNSFPCISSAFTTTQSQLMACAESINTDGITTASKSVDSMSILSKLMAAAKMMFIDSFIAALNSIDFTNTRPNFKIECKYTWNQLTPIYSCNVNVY